MDSGYKQFEKNYNENSNIKPKIDLEFNRQRNIYQENNNTINQQNYYSILQKTNQIFENKKSDNNNYENKIYNNSIEGKENINFYSNQSNMNDNNMENKINRIKNEINEVETNINLINKNIKEESTLNFGYKRNVENKIININNQVETNNEKDKSNLTNDISANNSNYYFNYKSDETFNRLNEQNTKLNPIDIKLNSLNNMKITNTINSNDNNYKYDSNSIYYNITNIKENNSNKYEESINEIEKRNVLNNKNSFELTNTNIFQNYNNFKQYSEQNNLSKDNSSKSFNMSTKNLISQENYNLNYNTDNNLQNSKSNNNVFISYNFNNRVDRDFYNNTEKKLDIKPYFQLKETDRIFNHENSNQNNKLISNQNNQNLTILMNKTFDGNNYANNNRANIESIKTKKNFRSLSSRKKNLKSDINYDKEYNRTSTLTQGNMDTNYRIDTYQNKKDEMTQTIPINDYRKFYNHTQNRTYRNQNKFKINNSNANFDKKYHNDQDIIGNIENYDINHYKEIENKNDNIDENVDNNRQFNTLFNNNFHKHSHNNGCIHEFNSFRQKKFNKNRANLLSTNNHSLNTDSDGNNKNICRKCLKSKMNFAEFNQIRICKKCQNLINNSKFKIDENNYFTFN